MELKHFDLYSFCTFQVQKQTHLSKYYWQNPGAPKLVLFNSFCHEELMDGV